MINYYKTIDVEFIKNRNKLPKNLQKNLRKLRTSELIISVIPYDKPVDVNYLLVKIYEIHNVSKTYKSISVTLQRLYKYGVLKKYNKASVYYILEKPKSKNEKQTNGLAGFKPITIP